MGHYAGNVTPTTNRSSDMLLRLLTELLLPVGVVLGIVVVVISLVLWLQPRCGPGEVALPREFACVKGHR